MHIAYLYFSHYNLLKLTFSDECEELELYTSFEEIDACILCGQSDDDPIELGKKMTKDNITIHHFCAVSYLFCLKIFSLNWQ